MTTATNTTPTVKIRSPRKSADYRHMYPGQFFAQDSHLVLDCNTGEFYADYSREVGLHSFPESVYNGRVLWFSFPHMLKLQQVRNLLKSAAPHAQTLLDEYYEVNINGSWHGNFRNGNTADQAAHAIRSMIEKARYEMERADYERACGYRR